MQRQNVAEVLVLRSFNKSHKKMSAICARFSFDIFRAYLRKGVFLYLFFIGGTYSNPLHIESTLLKIRVGHLRHGLFSCRSPPSCPSFSNKF